MSKEVIFFDKLAIRDTIPHESVFSAENMASQSKTLIMYNDLDKDLTTQCQGSRDQAFTRPIDVGSPTIILPNSTAYHTIETYFPFFRVVVSCVVLPTTGDVSVFLERGF